MAKKRQSRPNDACPFPPNVNPLPKKPTPNNLFSKDLLGDWRVILPLLTLAMAILVYGLLITPLPTIPTLKTPPTWNSSIPLVSPSEIQTPTNWTPKYTNKTTIDVDLILEGEKVLDIENCTYIINGKLYAKDNSKIILKNAELWIDPYGGYSPSYSIPNNLPGSIILTDSSSLVSENSSIVSDGSFEVTTWGTSSITLKESNAAWGSISCDDSSKFLAENCIFTNIRITSNASGVVSNSKLVRASFGSRITRSFSVEALTEGSLRFDNSTVHELAIAIMNSDVNIVGWGGGVFDRLSPSNYSSGGAQSNVTLTDSKVSYLNLFTSGCDVKIFNSSNIHPTILDGELTIKNSSCPSVDVIGSNVSISESVIGFFNLVNNTVRMKDTRVDVLLLHRFDGVLECDQVKVNSIRGSDSAGGVVSGSLTVVNSTNYSFPHWEQVRRNFEVLVAAGDRAVPNAELSLLDASGGEVWSGASDSNGRGMFSLTFNKLMVGEDNMTKTFTLRAVFNGVSKEVDGVGILSSTPIRFTFAPDSESMWLKWGLVVGGLSLLAIVSIVYLYVTRSYVKCIRSPYARVHA